jgi:chemotaxis protein histidine kinase CheA
VEQRGLVEEIALGLQLLETQGDDRPEAGLEDGAEGKRSQPILNEIFRHAHSLKGAAQAVGLTDIANLSRTLEELLYYAKGRLTLAPAFFAKLYETLEAVESAVLQMELLPSFDEEHRTF